MDPYQHIAELYDREHDAFVDDISFFQNIIDRGPVLEIGTGTGRVAVALARAGLEVYGIDPSPAMLERAAVRRAGLERVHFLHGSLADVDPRTRFGAILWPLNVLWHLSSLDAQLDALVRARQLMADDSLIIIDLSNPLAMADKGASGEARLRFRHVDGNTRTAAFSSVVDHEADQIMELTLWYDRYTDGTALQRVDTSFELRYIYRSELEIMLRLAGLRPLHFYGSYDLDPYEAGAPQLLTVASLP